MTTLYQVEQRQGEVITLYQVEQRQGEMITLYQVGLYPLVNDPSLPVSPSPT